MHKDHSRHHMKQPKGGKDPLAHGGGSWKGPYAEMPSIAHGYQTPEEYGGNEHEEKGTGPCNERHS